MFVKLACGTYVELSEIIALRVREKELEKQKTSEGTIFITLYMSQGQLDVKNPNDARKLQKHFDKKSNKEYWEGL